MTERLWSLFPLVVAASVPWLLIPFKRRLEKNLQPHLLPFSEDDRAASETLRRYNNEVIAFARNLILGFITAVVLLQTFGVPGLVVGLFLYFILALRLWSEMSSGTPAEWTKHKSGIRRLWPLGTGDSWGFALNMIALVVALCWPNMPSVARNSDSRDESLGQPSVQALLSATNKWTIGLEFGDVNTPLRHVVTGHLPMWEWKLDWEEDKISQPPVFQSPVYEGEIELVVRTIEDPKAAGEVVQLVLYGAEYDLSLSNSHFGKSLAKPLLVRGNAVSVWHSKSGDWDDVVTPVVSVERNNNCRMRFRWNRSGDSWFWVDNELKWSINLLQVLKAPFGLTGLNLRSEGRGHAAAVILRTQTVEVK